MTESELLVNSAALALEIDVAIMTIMQRDTPSEYREGYFFPFKYFEQKLGLDREQLRGFMRSLRNRGLTYYGTGFTEDGMINGAGYSLTQYGHDFLNKMNAIQDKQLTPTTHRQRGGYTGGV